MKKLYQQLDPVIRNLLGFSLEVSERERLPPKFKTGETYLVGKFLCRNCKKSWKSGKIFVEIRYSRIERKYNLLIYNQQCSICKKSYDPNLDIPIFIERIVSKLQLYFGLREAIIVSDTNEKTTLHTNKNFATHVK